MYAHARIFHPVGTFISKLSIGQGTAWTDIDFFQHLPVVLVHNSRFIHTDQIVVSLRLNSTSNHDLNGFFVIVFFQLHVSVHSTTRQFAPVELIIT
jgi:hypothetical protein